MADGLHRSTASVVRGNAFLVQVAEQSAEPSQATPEDSDGDLSIQAPFFELNEALTAARSRLTELTKAAEIAKVAGELQEKLQLTEAENQQLKAVLSQLQTENNEILSSKQITDQRAAELEKAAAEASAEVRRLNGELTSLRRENTELGAGLAEAESAAGEAASELEGLRGELDAQTESLRAVAEDSASEITRLQRELNTAKEQVVAAERERTARAAELANLREIAEDRTSGTAKLEQDLDTTIAELGEARSELHATQAAFEDAKTALEAAEKETGTLRKQVNASLVETDQLRGQLASAEIDLDRFRSLNAGLEQQVALLKTAAGEATNAARQNLLAVENQINEINAALASVKAEELLPVTERSLSAGSSVPPPAADRNDSVSTPAPASTGTTAAWPGGEAGVVEGWVPRPSPPRATGQRRLIAASVSEDDETAGAENLLAAPATLAAQAEARDSRQPAVELASLAADLPANRREEAAALLAELKAEKDPRGLSMTVPGAQLFAMDSEQIEPTALETLSSVAKLVDLYDDRDVLIVGHTDAVGDATYNQQLSERRASLVKAFFVENFEIDDDRLKTEGQGEQDPITSNATADGRNANRRVEVIILD